MKASRPFRKRIFRSIYSIQNFVEFLFWEERLSKQRFVLQYNCLCLQLNDLLLRFKILRLKLTIYKFNLILKLRDGWPLA